MAPVCEDCTGRSTYGAPEPTCYAHCSICGIKRACFGDDPEPLRERVPLKRQWERVA